MRSQTTSCVLMIRPESFGSNPETRATNAFQGALDAPPPEIRRRALVEFDTLVARLREEGVEVFVFGDSLEPATPDAVFPNNWFTAHEDGTVTLYPMQPESRRGERRPDIFESLVEDHGFHVSRFLDLTDGEESGIFLEGTGSLVLDHPGRVGYAALSARTRTPLLQRFAGAFHHEIVSFRATDRGLPIYHTNVILSIGGGFAVLAEETIDDPEERARVREALQAGGRRIVPITREQVRAFAGNLLELKDGRGDPLIACSAGAWASLDATTRGRLQEHGRILAVPIPTIETVGGGGVRCMLAELFLPRLRVGEGGLPPRPTTTGDAPHRG
jgi:hypothetical protein